MYSKLPKYRYKKTLKMLKDILPEGGIIYDLGVRNPFSEIMEKEGYKIINSEGQDFDFEYNIEIPKGVDLVTGFEILEHLVSPFPLLKNLNCKRLFVTVPLNLWFSKAYKNMNDERDRHYHEFEAWQFDWLLEKSGWEVKKKEYWKNPTFKLGIRPLLRNFTNRYYAVYAEKSLGNYTNYYKGVLNL
tara:strand:+ start:449 stop:1009 length:561 start_codon:yes stop_codon:yes gene_type:complete